MRTESKRKTEVRSSVKDVCLVLPLSIHHTGQSFTALTDVRQRLADRVDNHSGGRVEDIKTNKSSCLKNL